MIRLFLALDLPDDVRQRLAGICNGVPGVRWVAAQNLHLTLRFIGEVEEPRLPDIDAALSSVRSPAFEMALDRVDIFGDRRRARVLWAGVKPSQALMSLQSKSESAFVRAGLVPEPRKFHPHVTLARLKGTRTDRLVDYLEAHAGFFTPEFSVSEFLLYSSHLGRNGATYTVEANYPLDFA